MSDERPFFALHQNLSRGPGNFVPENRPGDKSVHAGGCGLPLIDPAAWKNFIPAGERKTPARQPAAG
jgi:hypothetical protein